MSGRTAVYADGWLAAGRDRVRLTADEPMRSAVERLGVATVYLTGPDWAVTSEAEVTGGGRDSGLKPWRWRVPSGITLVAVDNDEGQISGPWRGLSPGELVDAFAQFHRLTGVEWSDSIGHTAERLILATHPRDKGGVLLDQSPATPEVCTASLEVPYTSWRRDLTAGEAGAPFVHHFDANAQYLAAWSAVELGHGTPTLRQRPTFDRRIAGIWEVDGLPPNLSPLLPHAAIEGRTWLTTPTLDRVLEVCDGSDAPLVLQAWCWPKRSRFLRGAAERLRDARADAQRARAEAVATLGAAADTGAAAEALRRLVVAQAVLEAVKSLYRVQTGRLLSPSRDPRSGWARPDWGAFVIAQARVNLHRRLAKLGQAPFAIATDGLLFADDEPDGLAFAQRVGLPVGDGLGAYSYEGTVQAGPLWAALINARGQIWRALREIRREAAAS